MKLTATLLFTALAIGTAFGQTLKTYSGSYEGGQTTYQYYENADLERIFNGKFSYRDTRDNVNLSGVHIPSGTEINGAFKDNLKTGIWTAKEILSSVVPQYGNVKITMVLSGNFSNGKRHGQWTFKTSVVSAKKNEAHTAILNFNNNVLTGAIDFENLKGNLDNQGNFIQSWNVKDGRTEYIAEFKNNVFVRLIKREISNGTILFKYDNQNTVSLFSDNQKENKKLVEADSKRYIIADCDKINDFYNEDNQYNENDREFLNFYKIVAAKVNAFDRTIKRIPHGSTGYLITRPQVVFEFHGATNEEKELEEKKAIEEEKIQKQKETQEKEQQKLQEAKRQQEREEEFRRQEEIRQFENTNYGELQKTIKNKMTAWLTKSDYETNADYEARIKNLSDEKLRTITEETVRSKKQEVSQVSSLKYGQYKSETQSFSLFYREDTINVSVPISIAQKFEGAFSSIDRWTDTKTMGTFLPLEIAMVNNKWTVVEAAVFFNNHFNFGYYIADFKRFYKENGSYFFDFEYRPDINESKMNIKKVKTDDVKSFFNEINFPKKVFYYEWKSLHTNIQPLTFTIEELKITLPKL